MGRRKREKRLKRLKRATARDRFAAKLSTRAFSGPLNARRYGFTTTKLRKTDTAVFYSRFAAKTFLDLMIGEDTIKWKSDSYLITNTKVRIRGEDLKTIYEYNLTTKQRDRFKLTKFHHNRVAYIRSDEPYREIQSTTLSSKKRHSRKGMVLIKTLAAEFKMSAREARSILRANRVKKPDHGWAWRTTEEIDRIRELLKSENS